MSEYKEYEDSLIELGIFKETIMLPISNRNQRVEIVKFDSCAEMISKIEEGKSRFKWNHKGNDGKGVTPGSSSGWAFGQLKTYEATLEALKNGTVLETVLKDASEISQQMQESPVIEILFARAETMKRRRVFSEEGSELDIDRVLCGDPAHWARMTRGKKNTLVRLGVNIAGNCMEDEKLFNRLAAITGIATDILIRAGYAVELVSCSTSYGTCKSKGVLGYDVVAVTLKQAEEALDLQRIYSVGATGYFRSWIFQVYYNILTGTPTPGLGQTRPVEKPIQEYLELDYIIDQTFIEGKSQEIAIEKMFNAIIESK